MLPFDLHVLGLPPAFTLSQDQTLHLNFSDRSPKALSAVVVRAPNYFLAFACFESIWFLVERLQKWTTIHLPDARTSHLRTLSKIVGIGLSASSLCLFSVVAEASEGAAHYRVVFVAVNTLLRFFSCCRPVWAPPEGLTLWEASTNSSTPLFCFDLLSFRFVQTPLRGPRIIGERRIPSTPQRICFFSRPGFVADTVAGRALCTATIDLGRGYVNLTRSRVSAMVQSRSEGADTCVRYPR